VANKKVVTHLKKRYQQPVMLVPEERSLQLVLLNVRVMTVGCGQSQWSMSQTNELSAIFDYEDMRSVRQIF